LLRHVFCLHSGALELYVIKHYIKTFKSCSSSRIILHVCSESRT